MLWRERYDTRVLYDLDTESISGIALTGERQTLSRGTIALGGFSPEAFMGMGVWLRLIQDEYGIDPLRLVFFGEDWTDEEREDLEYVVPKSLHAQTILTVNKSASWRDLVQPDHAGRSFAALIAESGIRCLMIGPPTEERWDEYQLAVQSLRN